MARSIVDETLEEMREDLYDFALGRVRELDAREPTVEELIEAIVEDERFLGFPVMIYTRVKSEVQGRFDTGGEEE
jgi:hypothetical protein